LLVTDAMRTLRPSLAAQDIPLPRAAYLARPSTLPWMDPCRHALQAEARPQLLLRRASLRFLACRDLITDVSSNHPAVIGTALAALPSISTAGSQRLRRQPAALHLIEVGPRSHLKRICGAGGGKKRPALPFIQSLPRFHDDPGGRRWRKWRALSCALVPLGALSTWAANPHSFRDERDEPARLPV